MNMLLIRRERYRFFFTFLLILSLFSGLFFRGNVYADETGGGSANVSEGYDAEKKGSITVELQDIGTDRENVRLSLYQVGDLAQEGYGFRYDWSEDFKNISGLEGLDLNGIATAEENETTAEALRNVIEAAGSAIEPLEVQTTGTSGVVSFGQDASGAGVLEQGVYLILEEIAGDYGTVSPFLVSLPNCSDGENWEYDITCMPKAAELMRLGTIQVKKALKYFDGDGLGELYAKDAVFYVGLFLDAEGTMPFGGRGKNVKAIQIQNTSSNTVTFTGLPEGTYYIFETDAAGNNMLNATIQDGRLLIEANPDSNVNFAMGADSSGLMAALGINGFFSGTDASSMAINDALYQDADLVAAGRVNGQYQMNVGDNSLANDMGLLATKNVVISTVWKTVNNQSITSYYSNLVTTVGSDRLQAKTNAEYNTTLTQDLSDRVASVSGVNLDEELANLIKYQSSYTAAAKLITTADQMLETLLGLKQ